MFPLGFSLAYIDQFKVGLSLLIFPFLMEILDFYGIALAQKQTNRIRVIVDFYLHFLEKGTAPTVALFRTLFLFKMTSPKGWFFFSSHGQLKAITPDKIFD